ncbi:hypothetical protein FNV43_RR11100 [Rhamnella rubrinervis]|uniref:Retrotransposon gag domain-containing protein n=1 Tax=Rhamnella rubrinervis TaxID=2594499 RepID=A0A8K0H5C5_9ROSA|nr:hypothetical protein FNV43_RR11100 [Rhamnella rubrinervis]
MLEGSSGYTTSCLVEALERLVGQSTPQQSTRIGAMVEQFKQFHPIEFDSSINHLIVENWFRELEKVLMLMDFTEAQKVVCASFMLKEEARHWWDMVKRAYHTEQNPMVWIQYKTLFLAKFFPLLKQKEKEAEFLSLKQVDLSLLIAKDPSKKTRGEVSNKRGNLKEKCGLATPVVTTTRSVRDSITYRVFHSVRNAAKTMLVNAGEILKCVLVVFITLNPVISIESQLLCPSVRQGILLEKMDKLATTVDINDEENPEDDPEETDGSKRSEDSMYSEEPKDHRDLEDFDP